MEGDAHIENVGSSFRFVQYRTVFFRLRGQNGTIRRCMIHFPMYFLIHQILHTASYHLIIKQPFWIMKR